MSGGCLFPSEVKRMEKIPKKGFTVYERVSSAAIDVGVCHIDDTNRSSRSKVIKKAAQYKL